MSETKTTRVQWPGESHSGDLLEVLDAQPNEEATERFESDLERIRAAERSAETLSASIRIH